MLVLSDSRKARKIYVRLPGSTSSAGTASLSVKFCETLLKLCLTCSFTSASEKIPLMLRYVEEMISDDYFPKSEESSVKTIEKPLKAMVWGLKIS